MDEKEPDSEAEEEKFHEGWKLLERAALYYESDGFRGRLDDFAREHAAEFEEAAAEELKTGESTHRVEWTMLHAEFLALFEDLLSGFVEREDCTMEEFYAQCKDAAEDNFCALFEEHEYHWFVDALLAATEYQHFYNTMLRAARESERGGLQWASAGGPRGHRDAGRPFK